MKKINRNSNGFTLIEVLLVLGLLSIIILVTTNILIFGVNTNKLTSKEYSLQSDLRRATEKTNELIRYSKAAFAVPQPFIASESSMDPGWSYLMASPDSKRIVTMEYDESLGKHVEKVVVNESEGVLYALSFEKVQSANSDTVLKYKIFSYNTDSSGNKLNEKIVYETTVETINAIQVLDKGTEFSPSIALAFRSDGQTSGKGKNQIAYITIVIDISNSMNETPNGGGSTTKETVDSRISRVRKALIGDGTNNGNGIIQKFSKEENVFISLVPFANSANYPSPHVNSNPTGQHPFYEAYDNTDLNALITTIKETKADGYNTSKYGSGQGGTNTGDGLRRAYYLHDTFRARMSAAGTPINEKDQVHHYMILLVDGVTTFETGYYEYVDDGYYAYSGNTERFDSVNYNRYNWKTDWYSRKISDYIFDGNISLDQLAKYSPLDDKLEYYRRYIGGKNNKEKIVEYGKKNNSFSRAIITGNGSSAISKSSYVSSIGSKIQSFEDSAGIRSYLIGYASELTTNINYIGNEIGTNSLNRYIYNSDKFNLDDIFKNIATDIMADYWIAAGPQIGK